MSRHLCRPTHTAMSSRPLHPDEYELLNRPSLESRDSFDLDAADFESPHPTSSHSYPHQAASLISRLRSLLPFFTGQQHPPRGRRPGQTSWKKSKHATFRRRLTLRRLCFICFASCGIISALALLTFIIRPSYTHPPVHYNSLRHTVLNSQSPGRGNPRNEKVFVAASLYDRDGALARGRWGENILELIRLLGDDNVFLSIYESNSGLEGEAALREFEDKIKCKRSIVYEERMDVNSVSHITLPDGSERIKRIAYLAEARNRALRPLDDPASDRFDKLLYLNDVVFDPIDALQLLFSTNMDKSGTAQYRAACAVDFINPFKFYDTFATRDLEGFSMGVPFYPWFSDAGKAESRHDVLDQKDAVRVRSCWGGMVAFDARFFQQGKTEQPGQRKAQGRRDDDPVPRTSSVARFRAEPDLYWDASECCLIHADIQKPPYESNNVDTGIYMNPYVRVAYDTQTLAWLGVTRRFERLYSLAHSIVNVVAGMPRSNPRRTEVAGTDVEEKVWVPNGEKGGSYEMVKRKAGTGGFCGRRGLQVMVANPSKGQKNWESLPVPAGY
ncbi:CAP59_mtransfer superfamily domain-containing protein [Histoplasma capsulatum var. duboisii H88]|uniref:CAP59_mtransfer superfamily domain-containing protein n=3 Tax=Ajellomyces capsulatus TaxID=5037 RepID=A0A8A1LIA4_AJEC8|nr:CAP59_mtransfer superfamily domain-containing protein [Histoplasma capsulatum var. duboisii H88]